MPIGVGHCFAIFFVVIDVGANIFASMSMTWFVLGETGQQRGISMILSHLFGYRRETDFVQTGQLEEVRKGEAKCSTF